MKKYVYEFNGNIIEFIEENGKLNMYQLPKKEEPKEKSLKLEIEDESGKTRQSRKRLIKGIRNKLLNYEIFCDDILIGSIRCYQEKIDVIDGIFQTPYYLYYSKLDNKSKIKVKRKTN